MSFKLTAMLIVGAAAWFIALAAAEQLIHNVNALMAGLPS